MARACPRGGRGSGVRRLPTLRAPAGGPVELPVARHDALTREWAVIVQASGHVVCLVGWEPTTARPVTDRERRFEVIWSVEPEVVGEAAGMCAAIAAGTAPALAATTLATLDSEPRPTAADQLRLAAAITNRTLALLGDRP